MVLYDPRGCSVKISTSVSELPGNEPGHASRRGCPRVPPVPSPALACAVSQHPCEPGRSHILKNLLAFCFDLCSAKRCSVSRGLLHLTQTGLATMLQDSLVHPDVTSLGAWAKKSSGLNSSLPFDLAHCLSRLSWGGGKQSDKSCFLFPP